MEERVLIYAPTGQDAALASKINSGKIALQHELTTFAAVIGHVAELCSAPATARSIKVEYALPAEEIALHADYARVVRIVANILSNAIKFTPVGGRNTVRALVVNGCLKIHVKDNGIGLEPAALTRSRVRSSPDQTRQFRRNQAPGQWPHGLAASAAKNSLSAITNIGALTPALVYWVSSASSNRLMSTGLTRCASKPASMARVRSLSCPYPVNAINLTLLVAGSDRMRRATS